MGIEVNSYNGYIIRSILARNQFNIKEINNLESLKSVCFFKEEYPIIECFIKEANIEAIKTFPTNELRSGEYLDVILFNDEKQKKYIVTVYDNDMLEQDPQVIEIYSL